MDGRVGSRRESNPWCSAQRLPRMPLGRQSWEERREDVGRRCQSSTSTCVLLDPAMPKPVLEQRAGAGRCGGSMMTCHSAMGRHERSCNDASLRCDCPATVDPRPAIRQYLRTAWSRYCRLGRLPTGGDTTVERVSAKPPLYIYTAMYACSCCLWF